MSGEEITEKIIAELEKIAFADYSSINNALNSQRGKAFLDELSEMEKYLPAISQVKSVKDGIEIKFYDKLKALELLGRYVKGQNDTTPESDYDNLLEVLKSKAKQLWEGGDTD